MTYVSPNFKTKKELKEAIKNGDPIRVFNPGIGSIPDTGDVYLEGPHFPEPHRWYGVGHIINRKLVEVE